VLWSFFIFLMILLMRFMGVSNLRLTPISQKLYQFKKPPK
jgi:hypothetical protein